MLLVPPRHGKSELASKRFPAWFLGKHPEKQFISVSATAELASDFGRDVRNIISSSEYKALFGTKLPRTVRRAASGTRRLGASITPSALAVRCSDAAVTWF
jgi:hypothetical protein